MIAPTKSQNLAIDYKGNSAIVAKPGSGKTFTISSKIREIIPELNNYQGVIAISFTNKASNELKRRCLDPGLEKKESFFGTIHKFLLSEIIFPFGSHVFCDPEDSFKVVKTIKLEQIDMELIQSVRDENSFFEAFLKLYKKGIVVLEQVSKLAIFILNNSVACEKYLKARYTHIFVDEYQDCGEDQHMVFKKIVNLGIVGVAVGDVSQSIYGYDGKDPRHLEELIQDGNFKNFNIPENHRCHGSIIDYSERLMDRAYQPTWAGEKRVYDSTIQGSEVDIGKWLTHVIPSCIAKFDIQNPNEVAILVRSNRSAKIIHESLKLKHKLSYSTKLDEDQSPWALIFKRILVWLFDANISKREIIDEYIDVDRHSAMARRAMKLLAQIAQLNHDGNLLGEAEIFNKFAYLVCPQFEDNDPLASLISDLSTPDLLQSYIPATPDEIQILTIHKAKGLEFDAVFHLDLYEYIIPMYKGDYQQDLNLHYVGITRAKKCCTLCTSSQRHNGAMELKKATPSPFISLNNLPSLRAQ